jgi:hypothetical protein
MTHSVYYELNKACFHFITSVISSLYRIIKNHASDVVFTKSGFYKENEIERLSKECVFIWLTHQAHRHHRDIKRERSKDAVHPVEIHLCLSSSSYLRSRNNIRKDLQLFHVT